MSKLINIATGKESEKNVFGREKIVRPFCGVGNNCSLIGINYTNEAGSICIKTNTLNLITCWRAMKILEGISNIDYKTIINCWYVALQTEIDKVCDLSTQANSFQEIANKEGVDKFLSIVYNIWDTIPDRETLLLMTVAVKETGSIITNDPLLIETLNTEMA